MELILSFFIEKKYYYVLNLTILKGYNWLLWLVVLIEMSFWFDWWGLQTKIYNYRYLFI